MKKTELFLLSILIIGFLFITIDKINSNNFIEVKENIFSNKELQNKWNEYDCQIPLENSIINIIYIEKDRDLKYDCFPGNMYNEISDENKIKCNEKAIQKIYNATSNHNDCDFPLNNPVKNNSFYAVTLACNLVDELNESFVEVDSQCSMEGYYSIFYLVLDKNMMMYF